jgi:hypothetical protein
MGFIDFLEESVVPFHHAREVDEGCSFIGVTFVSFRVLVGVVVDGGFPVRRSVMETVPPTIRIRIIGGPPDEDPFYRSILVFVGVLNQRLVVCHPILWYCPHNTKTYGVKRPVITSTALTRT